MAKKNSPKDTAGVVFDTQSKMVISQGGTFEKMKEKINSVRAVVPNKSNNEIVLVLQHFENCVDRAVQAFVEGSAAEILKEWNVTGKKKPRKKKKPKPQPESQINAVEAESTPSSITKDAVNGFHGNSLTLDGVSVDFVIEQLDSAILDMAEIDSKPTTPECSKQATASLHKQGGLSCQSLQEISSGNETQSQSGFSSQQMPASSCLPSEEGQHGGAVHKKMASNIEKSVKDLHRCIASLTRYRLVVNDEMDSSIKRMKQTFAELQSCLMDREVALLAEMDKVKAEATAILDARQRKAENLRRLSDQSAAMSEEQLSELRADIKHFVSERKYDEDLGRAVKFTYEMEPLKKGIMCFGQVYHPQTGYSHRSRCSSSSIVTSPKREGMYPLQPTEGPSYPTQPHRQGHSNVRPGQGLGLQPRGQRLNDDMQHNRNQNRTSHRYQGNHFQGTAPEVASHSPRLPSTTLNGPAQTIALSARHCQPSPNGLPQRPLRTHRP